MPYCIGCIALEGPCNKFIKGPFDGGGFNLENHNIFLFLGLLLHIYHIHLHRASRVFKKVKKSQGR